MSVARRIREAVKIVALGRVRPPQRFFLGQDGEQREITVWLDGAGAPRDVTLHHSLACADPLTICVAFKKGEGLKEEERKHLRLKFRERNGGKKILGKIGLRYVKTISTSGPELFFFEVKSVRNHCLPALHLWSFYLLHAYRRWRKPLPPNLIQLSFLATRAMDVLFICPRPIGLGSSAEGERGNMFPVNVMGPLDGGYFGFALKHAKFPAHLVNRTRRLALSTVPMQQGDLAYGLGRNHSRDGIEWSDLPFSIKPSQEFQIPVPAFALRVRELEVEVNHQLGTHIFFAGRIVCDERFDEAVELCVVHGHYQCYRLKARGEDPTPSLEEDARIKRGAKADHSLF
jgi:flavin reductase (DIM6/NTAB) family NADH-FMN oxidoreductase RutF